MQILKSILFISIIILSSSCNTFKVEEPVKEPVAMSKKENILVYDALQKRDAGYLRGAEEKLIEALAVNGDNIVAMYELAETYRLLNECDLSLSYSLDGLQYKSDLYSRIAISCAACFNDQGEYDKSLQVLNMAIKLDTNSADLYLNRASSFKLKFELDSARMDLIKYTSMNPLDPFGHIALGDLYKYKLEMKETLLIYYVFLLLEPNHSGNKKLFLDLRFFIDETLIRKIPIDIDFKSEVLAPSLLAIQNVESYKETLPPIYYRFYQKLNENKMSEEFIYFLHSYSDYKGVKEWIVENEKDMEKFYDWVNSYNFN